MMVFGTGSNAGLPEDTAERMTELFGPACIDQFIRQAIQQCWMLLAKEKRTPEGLESQIRRLVDRALRDFREDLDAFGSKPEGC
jgi:hypothetical protein